MRLMRALLVSLLVPGLASAARHRLSDPRVKMAIYQNPDLHLEMRFPAEWTQLGESSTVGFRSPDGSHDSQAAFGIMKMTDAGLPLEQAVKREYLAEDAPLEWHSNKTNVGGQNAVHVVTRNKTNPTIKRVDFYVESPDGLILIQCMAPREKWHTYGRLFTSMIYSLRFLPH